MNFNLLFFLFNNIISLLFSIPNTNPSPSPRSKHKPIVSCVQENIKQCVALQEHANVRLNVKQVMKLHNKNYHIENHEEYDTLQPKSQLPSLQCQNVYISVERFKWTVVALVQRCYCQSIRLEVGGFEPTNHGMCEHIHLCCTRNQQFKEHRNTIYATGIIISSVSHTTKDIRL